MATFYIMTQVGIAAVLLPLDTMQGTLSIINESICQANTLVMLKETLASVVNGTSTSLQVKLQIHTDFATNGHMSTPTFITIITYLVTYHALAHTSKPHWIGDFGLDTSGEFLPGQTVLPSFFHSCKAPQNVVMIRTVY